MIVENFWRQLKHDYLHNVLHPWLNHLVWILNYKVTPTYIAQTEVLNSEYWAGHAKTLTTYQRYFKTSWKKLLKAMTSNKKYETHMGDWICGRNTTSTISASTWSRPLALHPLIFWSEVYRRHVLLIYQHLELIEKLKDESSENNNAKWKQITYLEPDGLPTVMFTSGWVIKRFLEIMELGNCGYQLITLKKCLDDKRGKILVYQLISNPENFRRYPTPSPLQQLKLRNQLTQPALLWWPLHLR